jgi:hypothetical protein
MVGRSGCQLTFGGDAGDGRPAGKGRGLEREREAATRAQIKRLDYKPGKLRWQGWPWCARDSYNTKIRRPAH